MKASVMPTPTRSRTRDLPRESSSDVLERAEAARDQEVDDHHRDRHEGEGGGERQVVGDVAVDDVADELRATTRASAR